MAVVLGVGCDGNLEWERDRIHSRAVQGRSFRLCKDSEIYLTAGILSFTYHHGDSRTYIFNVNGIMSEVEPKCP